VHNLDSAIRTLAESLPAGSSMTLPRDWVLARLTESASAEPQTASSPAPSSALLTVKQAAAQLSVAPSFVYRRASQLPFVVRVGRALRVDPVRLARWQERQRTR
jgi:Helix-turn-helix domain